MANLRLVEKKALENLFGMETGYVLDFSNPTFSAFFQDFGVPIDHDRYHKYGTSKANRMRAFWEIASDKQVAEVMNELLDYVHSQNPDGSRGPVSDLHREIVSRLGGVEEAKTTVVDFLSADFGTVHVKRLNLDTVLESVVEQRIKEVHACLGEKNAPLAAIFLCGSTLEGILLDSATKSPKAYNVAKSAPSKDGRVAHFSEWSLNDLINVAHEVGLLGLDVKKYSHALRDFRNYIHPYQQALSGFKPDHHTAKISWQVLQAAIADLVENRSK